MSTQKKPKILAVIGPTASGKSDLALKLAKKYHGEVVSCDSRQVYKGMDLGTGKVQGKWIKDSGIGKKVFVSNAVFHHCIDFVSPGKAYSVALFKTRAEKAIKEILRRKKLPILCGGTAHWIDAVIFDQNLPPTPPDQKLRKELEKKSASELFKKLQSLDPKRSLTIDKFNKRRLIRALEIVILTGKPVPTIKPLSSPYQVLWLGIKPEQTKLYKRIEKRLKDRLKAGMLTEVSRLHKKGISWKKLEAFGLEYKYLALLLQKKLGHKEARAQLLSAIKHYSKRQLTWWKKNPDILWLPPKSKSLDRTVKDFLSK